MASFRALSASSEEFKGPGPWRVPHVAVSWREPEARLACGLRVVAATCPARLERLEACPARKRAWEGCSGPAGEGESEGQCPLSWAGRCAQSRPVTRKAPLGVRGSRPRGAYSVWVGGWCPWWGRRALWQAGLVPLLTCFLPVGSVVLHAAAHTSPVHTSLSPGEARGCPQAAGGGAGRARGAWAPLVPSLRGAWSPASCLGRAFEEAPAPRGCRCYFGRLQSCWCWSQGPAAGPEPARGEARPSSLPLGRRAGGPVGGGPCRRGDVKFT